MNSSSDMINNFIDNEESTNLGMIREENNNNSQYENFYVIMKV